MLVQAPLARLIHKQMKERWLIHCAVTASLAGEKVVVAHESPEAAEQFQRAVEKELKWLREKGILKGGTQ